MSFKDNQSGQTLVEAVFVVSIIGMILFAFVSGGIYFNRASRFSKSKSLATELIQEKLEEWRLMRDNEPDNFWATINSNCCPDCSGELERETGAAAVGTDQLGADVERVTTCADYQIDASTRKVRVIVRVSWRDAGQEKSAKTTTYFTNHKSVRLATATPIPTSTPTPTPTLTPEQKCEALMGNCLDYSRWDNCNPPSERIYEDGFCNYPDEFCCVL